MIDYLDLVDYLLIAEAVTGLPAETVAKPPRIDLADSALHAPRAEFGGVEFYPDFAVTAAVPVRDTPTGSPTSPPSSPEQVRRTVEKPRSTRPSAALQWPSPRYAATTLSRCRTPQPPALQRHE